MSVSTEDEEPFINLESAFIEIFLVTDDYYIDIQRQHQTDTDTEIKLYE